MSLLVKKIITVLVVTTSIFSYHTQGVGYAKSTKQPFFSSENPNRISLVDLSLPTDFGYIDEVYQGMSEKTVLLIQDAHALPDAQKSIHHLILHFQKRYGVNLVGFEGAASRVDTTLLKSFPDKERLKTILKKYHSRGELSGVSAAAILAEGILAEGVENWQLYEEGLWLFLLSLQKKESELEKINFLRENLEKRKNKIYSKKLLEVDRWIQKAESTPESAMEALEVLNKHLAPEPGTAPEIILTHQRLNQNISTDVDRELEVFMQSVHRITTKKKKLNALNSKLQAQFQAYQTDEISAGAFGLALEKALEQKAQVEMSSKLQTLIRVESQMNDLHPKVVAEELEAYGRAVKESLFENEEQRQLDLEDQKLRLREKLIKLELTRDEWEELKQTSDLRLQTSDKTQVSFYRNAEVREEAMLKNFLSRLFAPRSPLNAVFVVGGFHAKGIKRELEKQGVSYASILPHISNLPEKTMYHDQMRGEVSWKDYFEVQNGKINLNTPFLRHVRDQLLGDGEWGIEDGKWFDYSLSSNPHPLKSWRDQLIRDLAKQNRLADAHRYTRYLDELGNMEESRIPPSEIRQKWRENVDHFISRLKALQKNQKLNQKSIAALQNFSAIPSLASSQVAEGSELSLGSRFDYRGALRARAQTKSETRSISTQKAPQKKRVLDQRFWNSAHYNELFFQIIREASWKRLRVSRLLRQTRQTNLSYTRSLKKFLLTEPSLNESKNPLESTVFFDVPVEGGGRVRFIKTKVGEDRKYRILIAIQNSGGELRQIGFIDYFSGVRAEYIYSWWNPQKRDELKDVSLWMDYEHDRIGYDVGYFPALEVNGPHHKRNLGKFLMRLVAYQGFVDGHSVFHVFNGIKDFYDKQNNFEFVGTYPTNQFPTGRHFRLKLNPKTLPQLPQIKPQRQKPLSETRAVDAKTTNEEWLVQRQGITAVYPGKVIQGDYQSGLFESEKLPISEKDKKLLEKIKAAKKYWKLKSEGSGPVREAIRKRYQNFSRKSSKTAKGTALITIEEYPFNFLRPGRDDVLPSSGRASVRRRASYISRQLWDRLSLYSELDQAIGAYYLNRLQYPIDLFYENGGGKEALRQSIFNRVNHKGRGPDFLNRRIFFAGFDSVDVDARFQELEKEDEETLERYREKIGVMGAEVLEEIPKLEDQMKGLTNGDDVVTYSPELLESLKSTAHELEKVGILYQRMGYRQHAWLFFQEAFKVYQMSVASDQVGLNPLEVQKEKVLIMLRNILLTSRQSSITLLERFSEELSRLFEHTYVRAEDVDRQRGLFEEGVFGEVPYYQWASEALPDMRNKLRLYGSMVKGDEKVLAAIKRAIALTYSFEKKLEQQRSETRSASHSGVLRRMNESGTGSKSETRYFQTDYEFAVQWRDHPILMEFIHGLYQRGIQTFYSHFGADRASLYNRDTTFVKTLDMGEENWEVLKRHGYLQFPDEPAKETYDWFGAIGFRRDPKDFASTNEQVRRRYQEILELIQPASPSLVPEDIKREMPKIPSSILQLMASEDRQKKKQLLQEIEGLLSIAETLEKKEERFSEKRMRLSSVGGSIKNLYQRIKPADIIFEERGTDKIYLTVREIRYMQVKVEQYLENLRYIQNLSEEPQEFPLLESFLTTLLDLKEEWRKALPLTEKLAEAVTVSETRLKNPKTLFSRRVFLKASFLGVSALSMMGAVLSAGAQKKKRAPKMDGPKEEELRYLEAGKIRKKLIEPSTYAAGEQDFLKASAKTQVLVLQSFLDVYWGFVKYPFYKEEDVKRKTKQSKRAKEVYDQLLNKNAKTIFKSISSVLKDPTSSFLLLREASDLGFVFTHSPLNKLVDQEFVGALEVAVNQIYQFGKFKDHETMASLLRMFYVIWERHPKLIREQMMAKLKLIIQTSNVKKKDFKGSIVENYALLKIIAQSILTLSAAALNGNKESEEILRNVNENLPAYPYAKAALTMVANLRSPKARLTEWPKITQGIFIDDISEAQRKQTAKLVAYIEKNKLKYGKSSLEPKKGFVSYLKQKQTEPAHILLFGGRCLACVTDQTNFIFEAVKEGPKASTTIVTFPLPAVFKVEPYSSDLQKYLFPRDLAVSSKEEHLDYLLTVSGGRSYNEKRLIVDPTMTVVIVEDGKTLRTFNPGKSRKIILNYVTSEEGVNVLLKQDTKKQQNQAPRSETRSASYPGVLRRTNESRTSEEFFESLPERTKHSRAETRVVTVIRTANNDKGFIEWMNKIVGSKEHPIIVEGGISVKEIEGILRSRETTQVYSLDRIESGDPRTYSFSYNVEGTDDEFIAKIVDDFKKGLSGYDAESGEFYEFNDGSTVGLHRRWKVYGRDGYEVLALVPHKVMQDFIRSMQFDYKGSRVVQFNGSREELYQLLNATYPSHVRDSIKAGSADPSKMSLEDLMTFVKNEKVANILSSVLSELYDLKKNYDLEKIYDLVRRGDRETENVWDSRIKELHGQLEIEGFTLSELGDLFDRLIRELKLKRQKLPENILRFLGVMAERKSSEDDLLIEMVRYYSGSPMQPDFAAFEEFLQENVDKNSIEPVLLWQLGGNPRFRIFDYDQSQSLIAERLLQKYGYESTLRLFGRTGVWIRRHAVMLKQREVFSGLITQLVSVTRRSLKEGSQRFMREDFRIWKVPYDLSDSVLKNELSQHGFADWQKRADRNAGDTKWEYSRFNHLSWKQVDHFYWAPSELVSQEGGKTVGWVSVPIGEYGEILSKKLLRTALILMRAAEEYDSIWQKAAQIQRDYPQIIKAGTARGNELGNSIVVQKGEKEIEVSGPLLTLQEGIMSVADALWLLMAKKIDGFENYEDAAEAVVNARMPERLSVMTKMGLVGPFRFRGRYIQDLVENQATGIQFNSKIKEIFKKDRWSEGCPVGGCLEGQRESALQALSEVFVQVMKNLPDEVVVTNSETRVEQDESGKVQRSETRRSELKEIEGFEGVVMRATLAIKPQEVSDLLKGQEDLKRFVDIIVERQPTEAE